MDGDCTTSLGNLLQCLVTLCIPPTSPVPTCTSCMLPFYVSVLSGVPCSSMQAPAAFACFSDCWDGPFLSLEKAVPENQPALLDPFSFWGQTCCPAPPTPNSSHLCTLQQQILPSRVTLPSSVTTKPSLLKEQGNYLFCLTSVPQKSGLRYCFLISERI